MTLGYQLARPNLELSNIQGTPSRICVIYIRDSNDTLYSWTVDRRSCVRSIHPGVSGVYTFNTTKLGIHFVYILGMIYIYVKYYYNCLRMILILLFFRKLWSNLLGIAKFLFTVIFTFLHVGIFMAFIHRHHSTLIIIDGFLLRIMFAGQIVCQNNTVHNIVKIKYPS